jgi:hypothetical protein
VQRLVDPLRERSADALHLRELVDGRGLHLAQATEMREQALPALRADSGDMRQRRLGARPGAAHAVADDGEAVRLVADLLDEMQARMRRRQG